jgi:hypothetical protein
MKAIVLTISLILCGCAITSSYEAGPNGKPVHFIDGMSASSAFEKAAKLCPSGYTIIGEPKQTTVMDYVMTINCK